MITTNKDAAVDKIGVSHHPFTVDIAGSIPVGSTIRKVGGGIDSWIARTDT